MIDLVKLILVAGDGGDGRVAFHRERKILKGGPSGGDGGDGGHIIIRGNRELATLKKYSGKVLYEAEDGIPGGKKKMIGAKGESLVIDVPIGTQISLVAENETGGKRRTRIGLNNLMKRDSVFRTKYRVEKEGQTPEPMDPDMLYVLGTDIEVYPDVTDILSSIKEAKPIIIANITEDGQEIVLCQGGFGGRGNDRFKSSTNVTPMEAEFGTYGEKRAVVLELKLLADIGLVGFPNAGKSTLLSVVTKARPKVASYPFTTIEPNLGVLEYGNLQNSTKDGAKELVLADIPGLIEGASEGKGLGLDFLRHIENCSVLLFVLSLDEPTVFDSELTDKQKAGLLLDQYLSLQNELQKYKKLLLDKKSLVSVNKIDIYYPELIAEIKAAFSKKGIKPIFFSGFTGEGLDELKKELVEIG